MAIPTATPATDTNPDNGAGQRLLRPFIARHRARAFLIYVLSSQIRFPLLLAVEGQGEAGSGCAQLSAGGIQMYFGKAAKQSLQLGVK